MLNTFYWTSTFFSCWIFCRSRCSACFLSCVWKNYYEYIFRCAGMCVNKLRIVVNKSLCLQNCTNENQNNQETSKSSKNDDQSLDNIDMAEQINISSKISEITHMPCRPKISVYESNCSKSLTNFHGLGFFKKRILLWTYFISFLVLDISNKYK